MKMMKKMKKGESFGHVEKALGNLPAMPKMGKPKLNISAHLSDGYEMEDSKWRKEEVKRLGKEIKALEDQIANWDDKDVAERAKKSLQKDLAMKKARLMEAKVMMED